MWKPASLVQHSTEASNLKMNLIVNLWIVADLYWTVFFIFPEMIWLISIQFEIKCFYSLFFNSLNLFDTIIYLLKVNWIKISIKKYQFTLLLNFIPHHVQTIFPETNTIIANVLKPAFTLAWNDVPFPPTPNLSLLSNQRNFE